MTVEKCLQALQWSLDGSRLTGVRSGPGQGKGRLGIGLLKKTWTPWCLFKFSRLFGTSSPHIALKTIEAGGRLRSQGWDRDVLEPDFYPRERMCSPCVLYSALFHYYFHQ